MVSILATPVRAPPVVTLSPDPAVRENVVPASASAPVALPIVVAEVPVELMRVVPKIVVAPLMALVPPEAPMVLAADVPVPKVLVSEAPVAMVDAPVEVRVVKDPAPPEVEVKVAAPAEVREELVKEKIFVPAVVPVIKVSQPVPRVRAEVLNPVPSVTFPIFTPLTAQVPAEQAVNVGATDMPLIVLVAAPEGALIVGEIKRPLVVEVTAAIVASVNASEASDPVSAPWTYVADATEIAPPVVRAPPNVSAWPNPVVSDVADRVWALVVVLVNV